MARDFLAGGGEGAAYAHVGLAHDGFAVGMVQSGGVADAESIGLTQQLGFGQAAWAVLYIEARPVRRRAMVNFTVLNYVAAVSALSLPRRALGSRLRS